MSAPNEALGAAALHPEALTLEDRVIAAVDACRAPVALFKTARGRVVPVLSGQPDLPADLAAELTAVVPGIAPDRLGGGAFAQATGCTYPYVIGEMARGIATAEMTIAAARAGFLGFFGSAGLPSDQVAGALAQITSALGPSGVWGANLIHAPDQPGREQAITELFIRDRVPCVSASAFMALSPHVVCLSAAGLSRDANGAVQRARQVFAKVSRPEVARAFLTPPPERMLQDLVASGAITAEEAALQARLPVASALTIEADSGGHTDNRPMAALVPTLATLRDQLCAAHGYDAPILLGVAGGIGTPAAAAAAFALGADYVVTGSVNQAACESGLSEEGRQMLCKAGLADVAMAPAADMFERGVEVQVLKHGSLFAPRARRLYEIWRRGMGFDDLPAADRDFVERQVLQESFAEAWAATRAYLAETDAALCAKADADPRQQMASVFRRHLFLASDWARTGKSDRKMDFQIWCGPAMGAFNAWVEGSYLAPAEARTVTEIGENILEGAARITRAQNLRAFGVDVPATLFSYAPRPHAMASATAL